MKTNTLVKGLLALAYSALYGLMTWLLTDSVNDPLFQVLFHIAYIAFICLTYDLFYPYMLMGFKSSRGNLPINRLGSFVETINAMHEHTDLDSLLGFASKALTDLLRVESTTIFVCDILAGVPDAAQKQMIQWRPESLVRSDGVDGIGSDSAETRILDETSALQQYARQHRGVLLAARSPDVVAREMHEYNAELVVSAHSEQRLLCLLLPGRRLPHSNHNDDELPLLQFFSRQLNIAIDRIDALRKQQVRKEAAYAEKMDLLASLSANIAHEMRTPLSGVRASISGVESYLPDLLEGYRHASALEPARFVPIRTEHVEMLENTPARIKAMVDQANTVIDLLLVNLRNRTLDRSSFTECSMAICVVEAVQTYPFKRNERQKVSHAIEQDFVFPGVPAMMIYVLFNLLKNALYSVEAACKGGIHIALEKDAKSNRVVFTDTGLGIDADAIPRIFEGFFTTKSEGTGAGLPFCKRTLNSFGAQIHVSSVKGEYTTFTLEFPVSATSSLKTVDDTVSSAEISAPQPVR
ncbi:MAG: HAMP domain-containing sensor histidine kinase [Gammaproteobacteria bacterium]|nr:HAMP domain-containing sensor histidine kinase [Gammaproteobacteria bacterium]MDP2141065.1 HAMP domain-containing sensor histidine kinase [Gammaproteobacteria bacterium]MDP2348523.1 HAMP domain-containing sensor histidine kinase [Gammaproteobacteria bacterium]